MAVLARSVSDEAISWKNKDCFAALAMTLWLNLTALPTKGEWTYLRAYITSARHYWQKGDSFLFNDSVQREWGRESCQKQQGRQLY
jgi:hypothetical protein